MTYICEITLKTIKYFCWLLPIIIVYYLASKTIFKKSVVSKANEYWFHIGWKKTQLLVYLYSVNSSEWTFSVGWSFFKYGKWSGILCPSSQ